MPIPEVGSRAGPSPHWHNRLSLAQLGCWGGAGLLGYGNARQRDTPGQRGTKASPGGSGVDLGKEQDHRGKYRAAAAAAKPPGEIRGPEATPGVVIISWAPTQKGLWWGFRVRMNEQFLVSK